ncbi:MAG: hypothetical protein KJO32_15335, partial [Deltaproteobacteria bacterium]|nr:hypothetical protein [Deltaproteobacteria bacterium]
MSENSSDLFGSISISPEQNTTQPEPEPETKQSPPRKKQTKLPQRQKKTSGRGKVKWLVLLILLVSAYSAAGFLLVPYLVKNVLPDYVESRLQVGFSVDKAIFNPFNFDLELHNLELETITADKPSTQFLTAQMLEVDFDLLSLLRGDLVCSSMSVDGLKMMLSREQNKQYNISYLFKGKSPKNQTGIIDFAELPFLFSLNNIN